MCVESFGFACAGEVRRWTTRGGTRFTFYDVCIYEVAHDLPYDLAWLEVRDNLPVYSRDRLERGIADTSLVCVNSAIRAYGILLSFCERNRNYILPYYIYRILNLSERRARALSTIPQATNKPHDRSAPFRVVSAAWQLGTSSSGRASLPSRG